MKKELFKEIEIPQGVDVKIEDGLVVVKGPVGENKRLFNLKNLEIKENNGKIKIGNPKSTKNEKRMMNTIVAHIKNMISGVQKRFEYKLKICFTHFPFTVEIGEGEAKIKNFLGEKTPRVLKLPKGADIKTDKEKITITSCDKELAGKVASDFERITKIRNRDRRIFQDGLYITEKSGKEI